MQESIYKIIRPGDGNTVKAVIVVFLTILLLVIGSRTQAGTIATDLEDILVGAGPDEEVPVIVSLANSADLKNIHENEKGLRRAAIIRVLRAKAEETQRPILAALMRHNVRKIKKFWIFNGFAFQATPDNIRELASMPGIESVRLDATVNLPVPEAATSAVAEWNISAVHAPELWDIGYTGQGVVVAGMDTGVDPDHQDLAGRWRGGENSWKDLQSGSALPYDNNGHGTQTMGLMVGGDAGGTAIGIAPDARWIAVKIFDRQGVTTNSIIHQGFQWLLDPDNNPSTDDTPDVVNNSWGLETAAGLCITEFQPDIETLKLMDIGVVFSGGNRGPGLYTSVSPGSNPGACSVGAVDESLAVTYFSSRGPSACDGSVFPELVAPGAGILTADLTHGGSFPDSYAYANGTSFAAPHVAGSMALLLSAYPGRPISEIESALTSSAYDMGEIGPNNDSGNGLLDVAAAYNMLLAGGPVCTDDDVDGYFLEGGSCGIGDCNDSDADINPDACDIKGDGIDQDCDGFDRLKGKPCPVTGDSGTDTSGDTMGIEGKGKTCEDGLDNDMDQLIDCADPDCRKNRSCK